MVKLFRVPVNDKVFKEMNGVQLLWYAHMLNKDQNDKFDRDINLLEYLASFTNPEGVEKIKNSRDKKIGIEKDETFNEMVASKFGRKFNPESKESQQLKPQEPFTGAPQRRTSNNIKGNSNGISVDFIKKYLDMDLDDIEFHPTNKK